MAITFPSSPSVNDTHVVDGRTWRWNGSAWKAVTGAIAAGAVDSSAIADGSIVNADINAAAAIAYSKLSLAGSITSSDITDGTIVDADISNSAEIAQSKIAASTSQAWATGTIELGHASDTTISRVSSGKIAIEGVNVVTTSSTDTLTNKTIGAITEPLTISASAATGTIGLNVADNTTYWTTNATANFTINLRWDASTTLTSRLSIGQMLTTTFMVTNGSTAYYATSIQVDGTTSGVTTRWQGGTAPTSGNANSIDMYTLTAVKTASSSFSVFVAQTRFA